MTSHLQYSSSPPSSSHLQSSPVIIITSLWQCSVVRAMESIVQNVTCDFLGLHTGFLCLARHPEILQEQRPQVALFQCRHCRFPLNTFQNLNETSWNTLIFNIPFHLLYISLWDVAHEQEIQRARPTLEMVAKSTRETHDC